MEVGEQFWEFSAQYGVGCKVETGNIHSSFPDLGFGDGKAAIDLGQRTVVSTSFLVRIPTINSGFRRACSQKTTAQLSTFDEDNCAC